MSKAAALADGSYFGEIALLWGTKQPLTVKTETKVSMYYITRDDFEETMLVRFHGGHLARHHHMSIHSYIQHSTGA